MHRAAQAVYPWLGSAHPYDAEYHVPLIVVLVTQELVPTVGETRPIFLVHTGYPFLECYPFCRHEAELSSDTVIPVKFIAAGVPRPNAGRSRVECKPEPLFSFPQ